MIDLTNKNIIVIGASGGVGHKISERLAGLEGINLILVARAKEKVEELLQKYSNTSFVYCDLKDSNQLEQLFRGIIKSNKRLDGLVYCAGISPLAKVIDTDISVLNDTYRINVMAFIETMKWFLREDVSNCHASVVAMSSVAANIPTYRQSIYSSSKAALEEAVRCVAKEALTRFIRVNAISAGAIHTDMLESLMTKSQSLREKFEGYYPFGIISTDYISDSIVYLLSDCSRHTTGSVISIDSGYLINK